MGNFRRHERVLFLIAGKVFREHMGYGSHSFQRRICGGAEQSLQWRFLCCAVEWNSLGDYSFLMVCRQIAECCFVPMVD